MGPSPILAAPGLRTSVRVGWRGGVATALAVVIDRPALWLLGALGYLLRGGAVILTLAILVLPSPISIRLMLGSYLGSFGFTSEFYIVVGAGLGLLLAVMIVAMFMTALVEIAAFERFVGARDDRADGGSLVRPDTRQRRRLIGAMVIIQLVAVLVLAAAAIPLLVMAGQAIYEELMRPNLAAGALYDRVLAQLSLPLFGLLVALVLVEMVSAVAHRRLMVRAYGLAGSAAAHAADSRSMLFSALAALASGLVRPFLRPLSTVPTAILGWLAMLAVLAPLGWALALAWGTVRVQFLAGFSIEAVPALAVAAALLSVVWLGGLVLAGIASAIRAGLWTSEELR
jgi:hypothetical protein